MGDQEGSVCERRFGVIYGKMDVCGSVEGWMRVGDMKVGSRSEEVDEVDFGKGWLTSVVLLARVLFLRPARLVRIY